MNNFSDRIKQIIDAENISVREFERKIGCSNGMIAKCIKSSTDISSSWVSKIIETFPLVNARWLLTGEGDMWKPEMTEKVQDVALREFRELYNDMKFVAHSYKDKLHDAIEKIKELEAELQILRNKLNSKPLDIKGSPEPL